MPFREFTMIPLSVFVDRVEFLLFCVICWWHHCRSNTSLSGTNTVNLLQQSHSLPQGTSGSFYWKTRTSENRPKSLSFVFSHLKRGCWWHQQGNTADFLVLTKLSGVAENSSFDLHLGKFCHAGCIPQHACLRDSQSIPRFQVYLKAQGEFSSDCCFMINSVFLQTRAF